MGEVDSETKRALAVQERTCMCCRLSWKTIAEMREHLTWQQKRITEQLAKTEGKGSKT